MYCFKDNALALAQILTSRASIRSAFLVLITVKGALTRFHASFVLLLSFKPILENAPHNARRASFQIQPRESVNLVAHIVLSVQASIIAVHALPGSK